MKQLKPDGTWHVARMDGTQHDPDALLRDLYLSRGWGDATEAELTEYEAKAAEMPTEEDSASSEESPSEGSPESTQ